MPRVRISSPGDAKTYGDINGVPVGTFFLDRKQLFEAGVHGRPSWGIHGTERDGAYAVVLNGGYEDDRDQGETVIYTGHGKGKAKSEPKEKRIGALHRRHRANGHMTMQSWEATQAGDQKWAHGNKALRRSYETKYPVRLIRGPNGNPKYSPLEGYRYDGLYEVVRYWEEKGSKGFTMCMFELKRWTEQDPLPTIEKPTRFWNPCLIMADEDEPREPTPPRPTYKTQKRKSIEGTRRLSVVDKVPKVKKPHTVSTTAWPTF